MNISRSGDWIRKGIFQLLTMSTIPCFAHRHEKNKWRKRKENKITCGFCDYFGFVACLSLMMTNEWKYHKHKKCWGTETNSVALLQQGITHTLNVFPSLCCWWCADRTCETGILCAFTAFMPAKKKNVFSSVLHTTNRTNEWVSERECSMLDARVPLFPSEFAH